MSENICLRLKKERLIIMNNNEEARISEMKEELEKLKEEVQELRRWKAYVESIFKLFEAFKPQEASNIEEDIIREDMEYYRTTVSRLEKMFNLFFKAVDTAKSKGINCTFFCNRFREEHLLTSCAFPSSRKYCVSPSSPKFEEEFIENYEVGEKYSTWNDCEILREKFDDIYIFSDEELTNEHIYEFLNDTTGKKHYDEFINILKETFLG